jgi:hypothetical protein
MKGFKDFLEEADLSPNTVVLVPDMNHKRFIVKATGKNIGMHLRVNEVITDKELGELRDQGYTVRYSDTENKKDDGPVSSGKAGVPQKD